MSKIKIEDLNANVKDKMNDDELNKITGGTTGGYGNDLLNADDVLGATQSSRNTVYVGGATGGVWKTNNYNTY